MTRPRAIDLYQLLPAVYRLRDAELGYPLRGLLAVIGDQVELIKGNIDELADDLFIETCAEWVIPYLGELVGNNPLHQAGPRRRADVAKTISYRRRKGTLPMLEELARDVTGWAAVAVPFFERLGWTQHLEHLRRCGWTDIRSMDRMARRDGPFDEISHTVDVRRPAQAEGWHNIHNLGFFLWRLRSYPNKQVPARQASKSWQFHFCPLGIPAPLFTRQRREAGDALAGELDVAAPIRPEALLEDLRALDRTTSPPPASTEYYGPFDSGRTSFLIVRDGVAVPPNKLRCQDLATWSQPQGEVVGVDVTRGRIAFGTTFVPTQGVDVSFHRGFSADLGGGSYDRRRWVVKTDDSAVRAFTVGPGGAPAATHASLVGTASTPGALDEWVSAGRPNTIITILDSRSYLLPSKIKLPNDGWLVIQATNRERPLLVTESTGLAVENLPPAAGTDPEAKAELTLGGIIVEGYLDVAGDLARLQLAHATLVPGRALNGTARPSLLVSATSGSTRLQIDCASCITGPLEVPQTITGMTIADSIVDGLGGEAIGGPAGDPGGALRADRSTILGSASVCHLDASDSIFIGEISCQRRQAGCLRFSYAPPQSRTPRRYRCQPDLAVAAALSQALNQQGSLSASQRQQITASVERLLTPVINDLRHGMPAYGQLALDCPAQIRNGAENGAEMGVFNHLKQTQREANLRIRLREYLPFGLAPGLIFVT